MTERERDERRRSPTAIGVIAAAMLGIGLAGCSSLGGASPVDTFDLTAPGAATRTTGRTLQILVPEPVVDRAYDGDRLVVRPSATEIAYFSGAQWSDRLPRLVQSRLIEALERSGRVRAVGRPGQGLAIDRQLVVDLRSFDYRPAEGRVRVAATVREMDDRSGRIRATRDFEAEAPVAGDTAPAVVRGFDAAFGEVLTAIVGWVGR